MSAAGRRRFLGFLAVLMPLICFCSVANATEEADTVELPDAEFPAWSPDGEHIAFQSSANSPNCDIWLIHPDGSGLERVTDHEEGDIRPKWGPDSLTLYFVSFRTGKKRLWKKDLQTGVETKVLDTPLGEYAISHSGREVILEVSRPGVDLIISSLATGAELRWLAGSSLGESDPTWSPDDQEAAFVKSGNLWARNAINKSNLRQLTDCTAYERIFGRPSWGTSGFIAFDMDGKIYKIKPDGSDLACIFQKSRDWATSPDWSPDGAKLVFVREQPSSCELWKMNADGSGLIQVTHTVSPLTFAPDAGTYSSAQTVTISSATTGLSSIRYTTDGSEPGETSTLYTGPVTIGQTMTLKAKAWKTGYFPSAVKSGDYVIQ